MKRLPSVRGRFVLLVAAGILVSALPAAARITRTRPTASSTPSLRGPSIWEPSLGAPFASLVLGSGVEYQRDNDAVEWGFPILIEHSFTERLKLTIEPQFASIVSKSPDVRSVGGFGDLEMSLDYEFLRERRYRPALGLEGWIKWPTASDPDLGEPGRDYGLGLIVSKDLAAMEVGVNVLYVFSGNRSRPDTLDFSLAAEWRVSRRLDAIAEIANVTRLGGGRGSSDQPPNETEATFGFAWHVNKFLKLEQGVVLKERGVWEVVFAWEWSLGGD